MNTKTTKIIAGGLVSLYLAICLYIFYQTTISWPSAGNWAQVITLFLFPGALYNIIKLYFLVQHNQPLQRRWLARLFSILAGVLLATFVANSGNTIAMQNFEERLAPFVATIDSNINSGCKKLTQHPELSNLSQHIRHAKTYIPTGIIWWKDQNFTLSFTGGSIDIDGSTLYYDGHQKEWVKFHNDNQTASKEFTTLTSDMHECLLAREQPM